MKTIPPILVAHFKSKGYTHMGGRLFIKDRQHWLLFNNAKGQWSLSRCWVAEPMPVAAE